MQSREATVLPGHFAFCPTVQLRHRVWIPGRLDQCLHRELSEQLEGVEQDIIRNELNITRQRCRVDALRDAGVDASQSILTLRSIMNTARELCVSRTHSPRGFTSEIDAVDGSSTGTRVPSEIIPCHKYCPRMQPV